MKYQLEDDLDTRDRMMKKLRLSLFGEGPRSAIHLSDLTSCITRSYWNKTTHLWNQVDDAGAIRMLTGVGLESFFTGKAAESGARLDVEGIVATPDDVSDMQSTEIKSTRMYPSKETDTPSKGWPREWIRRMLGYCYMQGLTQHSIAVVYIIQAKFIVKKLTFEPSEVKRFWTEFILPRKEALSKALKDELPPEPFRYQDDWMCQGCTARMLCDAFSIQGVYSRFSTDTDRKFLEQAEGPIEDFKETE